MQIRLGLSGKGLGWLLLTMWSGKAQRMGFPEKR